jgi:hypothetical protein
MVLRQARATISDHFVGFRGFITFLNFDGTRPPA